MTKPELRLGLKENLWPFSLLVVVNAFVGAMVGLERTILPALAQEEFHLAARSAILSFIVVFGLSKAATNYFAGRWADAFGRKRVLIVGWVAAAPVPFLLMHAQTWEAVLWANALLGVSQGLTWSLTVIMKIDLVGPARRGLAMGLNEFAGYLAVAGSALATGYLAAAYGLRPQPFWLGVVYVGLGLGISLLLVRETHGHAKHEAARHAGNNPGASAEPLPSQGEIFRRTSFTDRNLSSVSQAGLVNNLNDGMAWGLFPLYFAAQGFSLAQIGWLAAVYPAVWGVGQIFAGAMSDRFGRKGFIAGGMVLQGAAIALVALGHGFWGMALGQALLGVGTALVYPTLLATVGDVAHPAWRARAVGVYRLWRDGGYAAGAAIAGVTADQLGIEAAILLVAALTVGSGVVVMLRMEETLPALRKTCLEPDHFAPLFAQGDVTVVDVRSAEEYQRGHLPGAVHIPLDQLPARSAELPAGRRIITVCGKGGGRSDQAAQILRQKGWLASSLCGGTLGWLARGQA